MGSADGPTAERLFPIQRETIGGVTRPACHVPWSVAEKAYKAYVAQFGSDQSLERIAERGGFGHSELAWLLAGCPRNTLASSLLPPWPPKVHEPIS